MEQLIKHLENMKAALGLAAAIGEVSLPVKVNFKTALDDAIQLAKNFSSNSMLADSYFSNKILNDGIHRKSI